MRNYKTLKEKSKEYEKMFFENQISLINLTDKLCTKCNEKKQQNINNFYLRLIKFDGKNYYPVFNSYCISCICNDRKINGKLFFEKNEEAATGFRCCKKCKKSKLLNNENFRLIQSKYYRRVCLDCDRIESNECTKKRLIYAKKSIQISRRKYQSNRRKKDPVYKMRKYLSTQIYVALRKMNSQKTSSIMNYLPYSIDDLKNHLEKQFEPWMTWDNIGRYDSKTWNDNDQSTWKWNLDHIIPQCDLPYTAMTDNNFKKCWALENLRPYSAKQNIIDGVRLAHRVK